MRILRNRINPGILIYGKMLLCNSFRLCDNKLVELQSQPKDFPERKFKKNNIFKILSIFLKILARL